MMTSSFCGIISGVTLYSLYVAIVICFASVNHTNMNRLKTKLDTFCNLSSDWTATSDRLLDPVMEV